MITQTFGALVEALGWTLMHFLWQGALIGVLFAAGNMILKRGSAGARYHLGLACLALCAIVPVVTFIEVFEAPVAAAIAAPVVIAAQPMAAAAAEGASWWMETERLLEMVLPWVVLVWFIGVSVLSVRLVNGWRKMHLMCVEGVRDLSAYWQARSEELRARLEVSATVRFIESTLVHVPTVVGWLKPVILLPSSSLVGLSPRQLELVIAHELGHIRRNDYLVNLIQVWIETLLFFHPAVRWVSRRIRVERENCCDDLVMERFRDPVHYAKALTNLEAMRGGEWLAPAATGGMLTERIERIIDPDHTCSHSARSSGGVPFFGMILGAVLLSQWTTPPQVRAIPHNLPGSISAASANSGGWDFGMPFLSGVRRSSEAPAESLAADNAGSVAGGVTEGGATSGAATGESPEFQIVDQVIVQSTQFQPDRMAPLLDLNMDHVVARATPALSMPSSGSMLEGARVVPDSANSLPGLIAEFSPTPDYPRRAMLRGTEGYARVEFTVSTDGRVQDAVVVEAQPVRVFNRAALEAIRQWRFDPVSVASIEGRRASQEFRFTLAHAMGDGDVDRKSCTPITGTRICRGTRAALELTSMSRDRLESRRIASSGSAER